MDQNDTENYWNRSTSKAFSFDDDVDEEDISKFNAAKWDASQILNDDAISEASFDNGATGSTLSFTIKSIISEEALRILLEEQTLDDRLISKGVTAEEELKLLRRKLQTLVYSPSPTATAQKLLLGKTVSLEAFKSLHEKQQLLEAVLKNGGGGDAVLAVVLFMRKTLNQTNFYKILQQNAKALQCYLSYLLESQCAAEAMQLLQVFGRRQEAALLQFNAALACAEPQTRKQRLVELNERCSKDFGTGVCALYQQHFQAMLSLLEFVSSARQALDIKVQLNSTPIEVLYACCCKHQNWQEQDLTKTTSPYRFSAEQKISAIQFEWTALNERARAQAYADLECVFERVPTWHPMKQKQFHISFTLELAILRLYAMNAPTSVLYLFLSKMNNSTEKLELAQSVKCTKAIIDALVGLKDVTQLLQLKQSLPERSEEQFYCEKALKGLQTKRWATDNFKLKL